MPAASSGDVNGDGVECAHVAVPGAASAWLSSTHHAPCTSPSSLLASNAALLASTDSPVHDSNVRGMTEEGVGDSNASLYLAVACLVRSVDGP